MSKIERRVALVTGASSGMGLVTAQALRGDGYRVFGTSRKPMSDTPDGITMLICDVTDDVSVQTVVDELMAAAPLALSATKQLIAANLRAGDEAALELEDRTQVLLNRTADFREGVEAFRAKRPPQFRGR